MALTGKLVGQTTIKSDGDVFHEIYRDRPHHISEICPKIVQSVELHEGEWGTVGSVISWNYTHEGKAKVAKEVIEAIDEEKKSVRFKVIGGDLLELYKSFVFTLHVDTNGEDNLVTWTLTYEKLNENVEDPNTMMELLLNKARDIETHHLKTRKMALTGKLVGQTNIKSDGDVFHEIYRDRPHHISEMSPKIVQSVELHEGEWGTVGSVISWNYTHEGKAKVAKEVIDAIDEEKKSVRFKVIGGDLLDLYKSFVFTLHVDTKGEDNLVTWTLTYEKLNENVEDPNTLMSLLLNKARDIETHHLKQSN